MHSARRVVAAESYLGLVESGVGLLPAGGGLKELAIGCSKEVMEARNSIFLDYVKPRFLNVSLAKVSSSAQEAIKMGYLQESDVIVPNIHELLYQSLLQAQTMAQSGYRAPMKDDFKVGGRSLKATLKGILINMKDGGFISEHDFFIGDQIAHVISGGDVDDGALVSEEWLFKLERQAFIKLFTAPKTQERIAHMLTTHKPLRN
jgi:3-hydroxyacyl-CoA dehydrogenase